MDKISSMLLAFLGFIIVVLENSAYVTVLNVGIFVIVSILFFYALLKQQPIQIDQSIFAFIPIILLLLISIISYFLNFETYYFPNTIFILFQGVVFYMAVMIGGFNTKYFFYGVFLGLVLNLFLLTSIISIPRLEIYENYRFAGTLEKSTLLGSVLIFYGCYLISKEVHRNTIFEVLVLLPVAISSGSRKVLFIYALLFSYFIILFVWKNKSKIHLYFWFYPLCSALVYFTFLNLINTSLGNYNFLESVDKIIERIFLTGSSEDFSFSERSYYINSGIKIFMDNPIIGDGSNATLNLTGAHAHNDYVDILAAYGILGFLFWTSFHYFLLSTLIKIKIGLMKKFIFIISFFTFIFTTTIYSEKILILTIMSLWFSIYKRHKEQHDNFSIT